LGFQLVGGDVALLTAGAKGKQVQVVAVEHRDREDRGEVGVVNCLGKHDRIWIYVLCCDR
jgi:hypothetical protein